MMRQIVRFIVVAAMVGVAGGGCGKSVDALGRDGAVPDAGNADLPAGSGGGVGGRGPSGASGGSTGGGGTGDHAGAPGTASGGAGGTVSGTGGSDHGGAMGTGTGGATGHAGAAGGSGGSGGGVGGATSTGGSASAGGAGGSGGSAGRAGAAGMAGHPATAGASGAGGSQGSGGAGGGTACASDGACPATSYCDFSANDCGSGIRNMPGTCTPRPEGCVANVDPTCGCDGHVYNNVCEAARVGHDVSDSGGCPAPTGTFPCGPRFCAHGTTYCHAMIGGAIGRPGQFSCETLPSACMSAPSCTSCFSSSPSCSMSAAGDLTVTIAVP